MTFDRFNKWLTIVLLSIFHIWPTYGNPILVTNRSEPTPYFGDGTAIPNEYYQIDDMLFPLRTNRAGQSKLTYRWPLGRIPYAFGPGFTDEEMRDVYYTMKYIERYTCIRFGFHDEDDDDEDYLYIRNIEGKCQSFIGNIQRGPQQVALDPDSKSCASPNFPGHIVHELLHAIGFYHEHSRDDRDNYIEILYENLPDQESILRNFLTGSEADKKTEYFGVPYNYDSVMHYSERAGSINGDPTIIKRDPPEGVEKPMEGEMGQRVRLSKGDIMMVRNMYKDHCPKYAVRSSHKPVPAKIPEVLEWVVENDNGDEIPFPIEEPEDDDDEDEYDYYDDVKVSIKKRRKKPIRYYRVTRGKRRQQKGVV